MDTSCKLFIYIYFQAQRSWTAQTCVTVVYSSPSPELKPPIPAPDLDPRLEFKKKPAIELALFPQVDLIFHKQVSRDLLQKCVQSFNG